MINQSLKNAFAIQKRVIGALVLREVITRYGRHNIGFLWLFIEPMLFTVGVTILWTLSGAHQHTGLSISAFALTGYSSVLLWRNIPGRCSSIIEANRALMFHSNVRLIDLFLSRILLEAAGVTGSFLSLSFIFIYIGWSHCPENILEVILGWGLLLLFSTGLGIFIGAIAAQSELAMIIWHPLSYLLFPLTGAAFMIDWVPTSAQKWILLMPMAHGTEIIREGYFGSVVHAHYDVLYMLTCNFCLLLLGLLQIKKISKTMVLQ
ncbi:Polysialic acid transport protein KpsM [Legionella massiliensis]|uniref:Polysialic acid transport protein KpsM n=1 Tax=Legionella massiliensis TaxID=1034943 RepID=A0A078L1E1_9GAMM|nr:ABC transporter permease [Legionella massiliensis]CDZ77844.1 Polysialic acid transport protein KpsM [Legionella massiliensis]CEE13582.1 Polysialic acid transport protein KpsM [Legionella massiliensis]